MKFFEVKRGDMIFLTLEISTMIPERGYGIFWRKTDGVPNFSGKKMGNEILLNFQKFYTTLGDFI